MKRFSTHPIGIAQGEVALFSDFENDGEMWAGEGARECRRPVIFEQPFRSPPVVQPAISLWDVDTTRALRCELRAETVTAEGFEIVFRTWSDSRIARIRVTWTATGEIAHDDDWELY
ncbi:H-type lectin domain-containing protein [Cribrihabitans marinus]|uniref:H-type lectin domain-containing protein n=1 Tax=Cribrihabitans marinus TaxID=1227549 RepID=A0A1H7AI57_9RHOB|nr:H-type lectin domain-containing protein [Cribrihabitans marinus]GGH31704.1 hypothetical protein GCM10010973_22660 [Cribrihabitans marinus]SEJ64606.1 H-type lectin domain-containing protein [Cribrihabitans marinus]